MPAHSVTSQYFSGQGVVLLAQRDAGGNALGFTPVGNVSALTLAVSVTNLEHKESTSGSRGVDLKLVQETSVTLSMTMESINQENLSLALYGDTTNTAGGTIVSQNFTAYLGKVIDTGYLDISAVSITNTGGITTYVDGDNYYFNAEAGSIYFYTDAEQTANGAANNIADLDTVEISLTYGGHDEMNALTQAAPERWMRFEGLNTAESNTPVVVDVFKFGINPLQELALITEEIGQMTVEGNALSDATKVTGSKYFRVRQRVPA